jgi:hypothetical protein
LATDELLAGVVAYIFGTGGIKGRDGNGKGG